MDEARGRREAVLHNLTRRRCSQIAVVTGCWREHKQLSSVGTDSIALRKKSGRSSFEAVETSEMIRYLARSQLEPVGGTQALATMAQTNFSVVNGTVLGFLPDPFHSEVPQSVPTSEDDRLWGGWIHCCPSGGEKLQVTESAEQRSLRTVAFSYKAAVFSSERLSQGLLT